MISSFSIKNMLFIWLRKSIMGNLKDAEKHKKNKEWNKWVDVFQKIVLQIILV